MWIIEFNTVQQYQNVVAKIHEKMVEFLGEDLKQDRWAPVEPLLSKAGKPFVFLPEFIYKNENIREKLLPHLGNLTVKNISKDDENYFPKIVLDVKDDPEYIWDYVFTGEQKQAIIAFLKERKPELF